MTFYERLDAVVDLLRRRGRASYRALKREFDLDDAVLEDLEAEIVEAARRQHAKAWELRAVTSLSRLLRDRGQRAEARRLLADSYGWFTEGFETADLRDARAVLDTLS